MSIFSYLKTLYSQHSKGHGRREFSSLKDYLGAEKDSLPPKYLNKDEYLEAYLKYYLPLHLPELVWILNQIQSKGLDLSEHLNVLDLGAGPGTMSLSHSIWAKDNKMKDPANLLVDHSVNSLKTATKIFQEAFSKEVFVQETNLRNASNLKKLPTADLILMGHMLNEWSGKNSMTDKEKFLDNCARHLMHERSVLIIVEPPLREPTNELMSLRDYWVDVTGGKVLLPCPQESKLCPALKGRKGWCYTKIPRSWALDNGYAQIDDKIEAFTRQPIHYNGFSYMVLAAPHFDKDFFGPLLVSNRKVAFSDERRKPSLWCREGKIKESPRRPKHRGQITGH